MKELITIDDFITMDLRIGKILNCEEKEGSDKLLRLTVDFGEDGTRTILSGIKAWYTPEDLKDKSYLFIINLEPRKMMGELSEGMILCAEGEKPIPLAPTETVPPGTTLR